MNFFKIASRAANIALWVASLIGAVSAAIALLCLSFGYSIILFSTGSMAPTIRAGDLTVVKSISASAIRIGDILTVDRDDAPPITHRVTKVEMANDKAARIVTMKGDANKVADRDTYEVEQERVHVLTVPGAAHTFQAVFSNPFIACSVFVLVGALAAWGLLSRPQAEQDKDSSATEES